MRFDKPIYFQRVQAGEYDAATGNYGADTVTEVQRYASVTDSGVETMKLIYGDIKQCSFTLRLQSHYNEPFNKIRIGNKVYSVDFERKLRRMHVFVVSEVQ